MQIREKECLKEKDICLLRGRSILNFAWRVFETYKRTLYYPAEKKDSKK